MVPRKGVCIGASGVCIGAHLRRQHNSRQGMGSMAHQPHTTHSLLRGGSELRARARRGPTQVYDRLQAMALYSPVAGNQGGSYLTMWSSGGLQFEVIFFFSALAQMLVDQSYWQSAVAAKPSAAVKVPVPRRLPPRRPVPLLCGFLAAALTRQPARAMAHFPSDTTSAAPRRLATVLAGDMQ